MNIKSDAQKLIYDYFVYDNRLIAVLDNKDSVTDDFKHLLLLAEVKDFDFGKMLVSLSEEDYEEIKEYYLELKSAYLKEDK